MADKQKVTQADYARHVGVSEKTVSEWKYAGWLVMTRSGGVDVTASDARLAERPQTYRGGVARGLFVGGKRLSRQGVMGAPSLSPLPYQANA